MTFEEFVQARLPALLRFATVLTGDRVLAEDVVQEVLVRAHGRWRRVSAMAAPDRYVRRMIVNEFISWRRRWGRVVPVETIAPAQPDTPDHTWVHAEREELAARLARLPRRQQTVLVLRYYEQLADAEIAELLGCRPVTGTRLRQSCPGRVARGSASRRSGEGAAMRFTEPTCGTCWSTASRQRASRTGCWPGCGRGWTAAAGAARPSSPPRW